MNLAAETDEQELRELYRELILDHAKSPRHFGTLDGATHTAEGVNPLCGDKLKMYLQLNDERTIEDAAFEGSGCAISVASASLLTETVIGRSADDARRYFRTLVATLGAGDSAAADAQIELGKLRALEGVREYPSRVKCATLAWHALDAALREDARPASTE